MGEIERVHTTRRSYTASSGQIAGMALITREAHRHRPRWLRAQIPDDHDAMQAVRHPNVSPIHPIPDAGVTEYFAHVSTPGVPDLAHSSRA